MRGPHHRDHHHRGGQLEADISDPRSQVVARLRAAGCVFADDEAAILVEAAASPGELERMIEQRVVGLPLEQIVGWAEFHGLRIGVVPGVFVPRRRTEFLVDEAVARALPGSVVVDLCCGSGAIGIAIAAAVGNTELYAADIEPAAVQCARANIGDRGSVSEGDLYEALPSALRGRVDILAVNAPYVPTDEIRFMPTEARDFEPLITLDGGRDGLDIQRRVAVGARDWLSSGGHLLIETSERQAGQTARAFRDAGLVTVITHSDDLDATVVIGTNPAGPPLARERRRPG